MNFTLKEQKHFPLLERFKQHFKVTKDTIFAYDDVIYTNKLLTPDLLAHELQHLIQQKEAGLDNWVEGYINDPMFRLQMELDSYQTQLNSIKDRNLRARVRNKSALTLSSGLYGNIISYQDALRKLKLK